MFRSRSTREREGTIDRQLTRRQALKGAFVFGVAASGLGTLLAACGPETELVELSGPIRQEELRRAARFDPAGLVHMIALCESVQRAVKNSATPRALLDALVVRLAMSEKLADVTALVSKLGPAAAGASTPQASPRPKR